MSILLKILEFPDLRHEFLFTEYQLRCYFLMILQLSRHFQACVFQLLFRQTDLLYSHLFTLFQLVHHTSQTSVLFRHNIYMFFQILLFCPQTNILLFKLITFVHQLIHVKLYLFELLHQSSYNLLQLLLIVILQALCVQIIYFHNRRNKMFVSLFRIILKGHQYIYHKSIGENISQIQFITFFLSFSFQQTCPCFSTKSFFFSFKFFCFPSNYQLLLMIFVPKKVFLFFLILVGVSMAQFQNKGCLLSESNGNCIQCKQRFFLDDISKICFPVSPFCFDYDKDIGICTSCYQDYYLINGQCVYKKKTRIIPHCLKVQNDECTQCQNGFYKNEGICRSFDSFCIGYDGNGECIECLKGYTLGIDKFGNEKCIKRQREEYVEGCEIYSPDNECLECKQGYFLNIYSQCIRLSSLCQLYNFKGICEICQPNFVLVNGECFLLQDLQKQEQSDIYCSIFQDEQCVKCSFGYFFDENKKCIKVDDLCETFDADNGNCLTCYEGYQLEQGSCVELIYSLDPYCRKFKGSRCLECSSGTYMNEDGLCIVQDPLCKQSTDGTCTACYPGYILQNHNFCVIDRQFDCYEWEKGKCMKCSKGYYFDENRRCKIVDPQCKNFDHLQKICKMCYLGYTLYEGLCLNSNDTPNIVSATTNCVEMNDDGECERCSSFYYLQNGFCVQVSPYCRTYHSDKGYCTSCYLGYRINTFGECVIVK